LSATTSDHKEAEVRCSMDITMHGAQN